MLVEVLGNVVRGEDLTLLCLPDTTPDPVVTETPLLVAVRVDVVCGGDRTLLLLPDPTPDTMLTVSL